jgi:rubrerythrin
MSTTSLLDAIAVVKQNERIASDSYAGAAKSINNPIGKQLFEQLSQFEQFHFEIVSKLEKSLQEKGKFVAYEGKDFPLPPVFEIKAAKELHRKSAMEIITQAMELEKLAEKAYTDLAEQIKDLEGHDTFVRLAREENAHYFILREAYWTLTNLGMWKWTRP